MKDHTKGQASHATQSRSASIGTSAGKRTLIQSRYANVQHIMRKTAAGTVAPDAGAALDATAGSTGEPLPAKLQGKLQHALGDKDLSGVRIHTGTESVNAADAIAARAFTTGKDIHLLRTSTTEQVKLASTYSVTRSHHPTTRHSRPNAGTGDT